MNEFEKELAVKLVRTCLRIKPDDEVLIDTFAHTIGLAEAIALECYRVGAIPAIHLDTDDLFRSMLSEIPVQNLSKTPQHLLAAYDAVDATIFLGGPQDPNVFDAAPPEKESAFDTAFKPLWDRGRELSIRGAFLTLGICTPQRAGKYGVDFERWHEVMTAALAVDLDKLTAKGAEVAAALGGARTVRITAPGAVDLTFQLGERWVSVEDGIIDEEDLEHGVRWTDLPTGYVSVAPLETSANGTVAFPATAIWGKVVRNPRWTFRDGQLDGFEADENADVFEAFLAGATGDKDRLGEFGIGINPKAEPVGAGLMDWIADGAVSIGIGNNLDIGGQNDSTFSWRETLTDATVELDGELLLREGQWAY
jgi:leucyl aminopeptidase (aminopeptidase T)